MSSRDYYGARTELLNTFNSKTTTASAWPTRLAELDTAWDIVARLDTFQVNWDIINPLAYAKATSLLLMRSTTPPAWAWLATLCFQRSQAPVLALSSSSLCNKLSFAFVLLRQLHTCYYNFGKCPKSTTR
ncbi:hypothetical protein C8Q78DRAFT_998908 [Trametes maxima]|nr:hypothetical protein C8Q78DRAFT_998908 [Trametes maxima]